MLLVPFLNASVQMSRFEGWQHQVGSDRRHGRFPVKWTTLSTIALRFGPETRYLRHALSKGPESEEQLRNPDRGRQDNTLLYGPARTRQVSTARGALEEL